MEKRPIISVIVPTYNRYKYLKGSIEAFRAISSNEIEYVIQDNTADNSEIVEYLDMLNDSRIKYFHKREHVSQAENSDLAVSNSIGEYVAYIGDDDAVCATIIDAAKYCKLNCIDTCLSELPGFNWPDMEFIGRERQANYFITRRATGMIRDINTQEQIDLALEYADGIPEFMPRVYHGITSRKCLDLIKRETGSYFPGPSPDMASSLAISLLASRAIFISDYLIVSGYGYGSARGEGNRQQHYGKISEKPWLPKDTEVQWDHEIPMIFSAETIIAESLSRCLRAMDRIDLLKKYSYGTLYAVFFVKHPDARKYMLSFLIKRPARIIKFIAGIFNRKRYSNLYKKTHKDGNYIEIENVRTLLEAQELTMRIRGDISYKYDDEG